MTIINVGAVVVLQYQFINGELYDPDVSVTGAIYKSGVEVFTFNPTNVSVGNYTYEWTTTEAGSFEVRVTGTDSEEVEVVHRDYFLIGDTEPSASLEESRVFHLLGHLTPVYIDPEDILQYYPDGNLVEITELIYRKSLELEKRLGKTNLSSLTAAQYEFLIASVMCDLSRIYGMANSGFGGFGEVDSFKLGDLEVSKNLSPTKSSGSTNAGDSDNWCELAAALKGQILSYDGRLRPVVPGAIYAKQIPKRDLKSSDF